MALTILMLRVLLFKIIFKSDETLQALSLAKVYREFTSVIVAVGPKGPIYGKD